MSRWQDFPLPDGSYSDDTRPWSRQDVVNYLPTYAELPGTRSRVQYKPVPGMKLFATVGDGPHRGARDVEGKAFVVSGSKLYQVAVSGVATELGTIPGTGRVTMTHNQIDGGNELVIGTVDNSYVWNTVTETLTATGVGLAFVDFLNQRILGIEPQRRFFRYSGLASATDYNDLDNEAAESSPDRIVCGLVASGQWFVFGERTIEVWDNSPNDSTAFQRAVVVEKGCANGHTVQRLDNSVIWLGNDFIVYQMRGYQERAISTKAQAAAFRRNGAGKAFAFTYEDNGYVVYYLTFANGETWGYDVTNQRWHRRESFGLDRWRANTLFKWNGEWYAGDYRNGKLYRLTWGYVYEGCEIMPRSIRTGALHADGNRLRVNGLKMLVNTGAAPSVPGPECLPVEPPASIGAFFAAIDNQVYLQRSDDQAATWPTQAATTLTPATSEVCTGAGGGRVFHFGFTTNARTSVDGVTWEVCTFDTNTGGAVGVGTLIYINSEWQLYHNGLHYSANGVDFIERNTGGAFVRLPTFSGSTVLAISNSRDISRSTDSGATFVSHETLTAFNASDGLHRLQAGTTRFLAFGRDGSGNLLIGKSATGATGTWTTESGPDIALVQGVARNPTNGRIVIILELGVSFYTDDDGDTWTAGATCPAGAEVGAPRNQGHNMIYADGYFVFGAAQGSGVNHIYRSPDGVTAWEFVFSGPNGYRIDSLAYLA